jgi:hypothetical protein
MSHIAPPTPAGWYPDTEQPGNERYWDGTRWTDARRPLAMPQPYAPPLPPRAPGAGLATASLVLGIIGAVFAFIPGVTGLGIVLGLLAAILGGIALMRKTPARPRGVAGSILGSAAFIVAIIMSFVYAFAGAGAAVDAIDDAANVTNPPAVSAPPAAEPTPEKAAEEPAAPVEPAGPTVGVPFEVQQNDGVAKITIVSASYGPTTGGDFDLPADNGGYLILNVLWETAEGVSSSNPLYISAKDANGVRGDIAIVIPQSLGSGDIPVGDKTVGNVGFDIGPGPYTVVVTDQLLQEEARLTVNADNR